MSKLNWKSIIGWGCAALVAVFIVYTNMQEQKALQNSGKKNVYAVLPLSGHIAVFGKAVKEAVDLWQETHPNKLFNIIYVDSQSKPDVALTAVNQATINSSDPIVFAPQTFVGNVLAPVLEKRNGFLFNITAIPLKGKYKSYQRVSSGFDDVVTSLLGYTKKFPTLAIIYLNEDFGAGVSTLFKQEYEKLGGKVLSTTVFNLNERDIRLEIYKLLQDNPSAIALFGMPNLLYINIIKEIKAQGYQGQIITDVTLSNPYLIEALQDVAEGIISSITLPVNQETNSLYKETKARNLPFYYVWAEVWDTLDLIQYTLENNLPFNQETYTKMGKWKGVAGDVIFPGNGDSLYPFILVQYKDGKFVPVAE